MNKKIQKICKKHNLSKIDLGNFIQILASIEPNSTLDCGIGKIRKDLQGKMTLECDDKSVSKLVEDWFDESNASNDLFG